MCAYIKDANLHAYNAKIPQEDNDALSFFLISNSMVRKLGESEECVVVIFG